MKPNRRLFPLSLCLAASPILQAAIFYEGGHTGYAYLTHSDTDTVISYDWGASGDLYYMTSGGYPDVDVWKTSGGTTSNIYANANNYAGASVVAVGDYVYFNDSTTSNTQNIWKYGPTSGGSASAQLASTTHNWGLYKNGGALYMTGAVGFGTNQVFYSPLGSNGGLLNDPATDLGTTFGSSGPLAFDAAGNMYYAPGFGDTSIYRWSAAQITAAIADPTHSPLPTTGVLWYDYSSDFSVSGGTGMAIDDDGNLVLSLTDFTNPSALVEFLVDDVTGSFAGYETLLTSTDRLGDVRFYDGELYVAAGNQILQIVPEPSVGALAMAAAAGCLVLSRRRKA
ncbi:MAG: Uncharacterized protein E1N59_1130 [Puniceicoccaceae bacterium 5H]|nr:MAG: Uncharacterized protein E1N59_1130 [Puniceicoccaceae bacterium 5H]